MRSCSLRLAALVLFAASVLPEARLSADERSSTTGPSRADEAEDRVRDAAVPAKAGADTPDTHKTKRAAPKPARADEDRPKAKDAAKPKDGKQKAAKKDEPKPLPGKTIDFDYDAKDVGTPSRAYEGRIFVHERASAVDAPLPLVVFIHGLNKARIRFRWMGGGEEGDVRRIVSDLIDEGKIRPVLLAAPSSIQPDAVAEGSSFPIFDFDKFLELTEQNLDGVAKIDETRIIVAGHSGAGCSSNGGIVAAVRAKHVPFSVISIDTCMGVDLAKALGSAPPSTHVVVTWETVSWDRAFDAFTATFQKTLADNPADEGVLRALDKLPALPRAHDATVGQTFAKYLPKLVP